MQNTKRYLKSDVAWFYSSKDQLFELSNMCVGFPIMYGGRWWKSTEHLYQASKYSKDIICIPEMSKDHNVIPNVRERIFAAKSCMAAKMTQKCAVFSGFVRSDWEKQMVQNMLFVLELKVFHNYEAMSEVFDETEGRDIVEISSKDNFWGCTQQYSVNGTMLVGKNILGQLLTDVRSRKELIKANGPIEPLHFFID